MTFFSWRSLLGCLILLSLNVHAERPEQHVVLISIDGFRHDYIEKHDAKNIAELAKSGVRSKGLIPVYPSKTFPNHLSIITGRYPTNHGLVDNNFYDTERQQKYSMASAKMKMTTSTVFKTKARALGVRASGSNVTDTDVR